MNADVFKGTVAKYQKIRHINTMEQLRAHTTVGSNRTFLKYMKDPELMPLGVWLDIMKALNIPQEERLETLK